LPSKGGLHDQFKNIVIQEDESVQSIQWPSKVETRNLEAQKNNENMAEQIFSASEQVKNAVNVVN